MLRTKQSSLITEKSTKKYLKFSSTFVTLNKIQRQLKMELFVTYKYEERSNVYKCNVTRVIKWKFGKGVLRVAGDHFEGKTNDDVEEVLFRDLKLENFPRLLNYFFPNLNAVTITNCDLQSVVKSDLHGLKHLKQLSLNGNKISSLHNDLFEDTPNVEIISFYGNRLEFIGQHLLDSLDHLQSANFKMNDNIDAGLNTYGSGVSLKCLKEIFKQKCQPTFTGKLENYFDDLMQIYA